VNVSDFHVNYQICTKRRPSLGNYKSLCFHSSGQFRSYLQQLENIQRQLWWWSNTFCF